MRTPVIALGGQGQLGRALVRAYHGTHFEALSHTDCDITDAAAVERTLWTYQPEVVINCAADTYTPAPKWQTNADAVRIVAAACRRQDALLVQISTDAVFDGAETMSSRGEMDPVKPRTAYGLGKAQAECHAQTAGRWAVVRTCGLYDKGGSRRKGGNFVETIRRSLCRGVPLRMVNDVFVTPTYAADVARALRRLIPRWQERWGAPGTVHLINTGAVTWYDFAVLIAQHVGQANLIEPCRSCHPHSTVLENRRSDVPTLRSVPAALTAYLRCNPTQTGIHAGSHV